jgi:hypothetical protein
MTNAVFLSQSSVLIGAKEFTSMSLLPFPRDPSEGQLRQFGLSCPIGVLLLCLFWQANAMLILAAFGLGVLSVSLALTTPRLLRPLFLILLLVLFPIGFVLSEVILLLIFAFVVVPIALTLRILGRDTLKRRNAIRNAESQESLWALRDQSQSPDRYYRQF